MTHRQDAVLLAPPVLKTETYVLKPESAWYGFLQAVFQIKVEIFDGTLETLDCVLVSTLERLEGPGAKNKLKGLVP